MTDCQVIENWQNKRVLQSKHNSPANEKKILWSRKNWSQTIKQDQSKLPMAFQLILLCAKLFWMSAVCTTLNLVGVSRDSLSLPTTMLIYLKLAFTPQFKSEFSTHVLILSNQNCIAIVLSAVFATFLQINLKSIFYCAKCVLLEWKLLAQYFIISKDKLRPNLEPKFVSGAILKFLVLIWIDCRRFWSGLEIEDLIANDWVW